MPVKITGIENINKSSHALKPGVFYYDTEDKELVYCVEVDDTIRLSDMEGFVYSREYTNGDGRFIALDVELKVL